MITIDVRHDGLGRLARVVAPVKALAERRALAISKRWDAAMGRRQAQLGAVAAPLRDAVCKLDAEEQTRAAEEKVSALTSILIGALAHTASDEAALHYDTSAYGEAAPVEPVLPVHEAEPQKSAFKRAPLTVMTLLNPSALRRRRDAAEAKFDTAYNGWMYLKRWREQEYAKAYDGWRAAHAAWQEREALFRDAQTRANARLDALVQGYAKGESEAIIGLLDLALLSLDRPDGFPVFWTMAYSDGALQIDYDLPSMAQVPLVKAVKYLPSRQSFEPVVLADKERERLYSEAVFQTALAVLHTLFATDTAGAIRAVSFNGWANYIDAAALRPGRACILSVSADKRTLESIDLAAVDPKACFKALNGVMSPKLAALVERASA